MNQEFQLDGGGGTQAYILDIGLENSYYYSSPGDLGHKQCLLSSCPSPICLQFLLKACHLHEASEFSPRDYCVLIALCPTFIIENITPYWSCVLCLCSEFKVP
jgi:hypothetical protein